MDSAAAVKPVASIVAVNAPLSTALILFINFSLSITPHSSEFENANTIQLQDRR
jgi:hypothetical protein